MIALLAIIVAVMILFAITVVVIVFLIGLVVGNGINEVTSKDNKRE